MRERSLQITYRKGRVMAAYLYPAGEIGEKSARTEPSQDDLLVVDYAANGRPIGIEIVSPDAVTFARLNELLKKLGMHPLEEEDYRPLSAA
jgi:uncharacterized protein YuzE